MIAEALSPKQSWWWEFPMYSFDVLPNLSIILIIQFHRDQISYTERLRASFL